MLPLGIQEEIMKRVPVKSLIRFRLVSKTWNSLINSSRFITGYSGQVQHLLVRYEQGIKVENKYDLVVDDDSFPQQKTDPVTLPLLVHMVKYSTVVGSSHGLLCLQGSFLSETEVFVIWNISIRKAVAIVEHDEPLVAGIYKTHSGFGVCRETNDPKIVKVTYVESGRDAESVSAIPWQIVVFTLSTGAWRRPYSTSLPRKSIRLFDSHVVVNGFINWLANDTFTTNGGFRSYNLIISFDITSEEFKEVNLPHSLAHQSIDNLSVYKLKESLVVLECDVETNNTVFGVWMMEDGVPNSFKKLFTFNVNTPHASVKGFKKTGEPIIEIIKDDHHRQLFVYESCSKRIIKHNLGLDVVKFSFCVYPYKETLLLLDQRDLSIYNEGKRFILKKRKHKALEALKQCMNQ